jgi:hypothetical protein
MSAVDIVGVKIIGFLIATFTRREEKRRDVRAECFGLVFFFAELNSLL